VAVVLFFSSSDYFKAIKKSSEGAFDGAVLAMLGEGGSSGEPKEGSFSGKTGSPPAEEGETSIELKSPAFENGQFIPPTFTADGKNINPALIIGNVPQEIKSFALIVEDADAPGGPFVHWVVFDIPVVGQINENSVPGKQGINDFGTTNYMGPDPPPGTEHGYFFKIYALDTMLDLQEGISKAQLENAMQGHILVEVVLMGLYKR